MTGQPCLGQLQHQHRGVGGSDTRCQASCMRREATGVSRGWQRGQRWPLPASMSPPFEKYTCPVVLRNVISVASFYQGINYSSFARSECEVSRPDGEPTRRAWHPRRRACADSAQETIEGHPCWVGWWAMARPRHVVRPELLPAPSRTARTQPMYDWERECGAHHGPITRGHVVRNDRDSVPAGVASRLYMRDQGQYRGSFIEPFASMRDWESQCGAHHGPLTRRGASRYYSVPAVSVGRARSCTGGTCRHPRWYL